MRLDEARYGGRKHNYRNRPNKEETQLQNIEEAYKLATEYVLRKPARRFDVYAAVTDDGGRGHGRQANEFAAAAVAEVVEMAAEVAALKNGAHTTFVEKKVISNGTARMLKKPSRKKRTKKAKSRTRNKVK